MQMLLFTDNDTENTERVWKRNRFFGNQNGELTLSKRDFPENTLIYINQWTVLMVKGNLATHLVKVVLGQVLTMINCPPDINNDVCRENKVKMFVLMYNTEIGEFKDIQKLLGYIMVRGDKNECFLSYGYNSDKSTVLFSTFKQVLPNIFQSTSFKKYNSLLTKEGRILHCYFLIYLQPLTTKNQLINTVTTFSFI